MPTKSTRSSKTKAAEKTPFVVRELGLKAFVESNRIDFKLEGPNKAAERASMFYNSPDREVKLDGKLLSFVETIADKDSGEPVQIHIKLGKENIVLGRCKDSKGPVQFYRSMERSGNSKTPKTAAELMAALGNFTK